MGLEPATCRLQIGCSTLLSYASIRVSAEESSTVRPESGKWKRWHGFAHLGKGANRGLYQPGSRPVKPFSCRAGPVWRWRLTHSNARTPAATATFREPGTALHRDRTRADRRSPS